MAVAEIAKFYFSVHKILEDATRPVGVSKRAGIVLLLLSGAAEGEMETAELVKKFGAWHMSKRREGASKDVSTATAELDVKDLTFNKKTPHRVVLTQEGRNVALDMTRRIDAMIAELPPPLRELISKMVSDNPQRMTPGREMAARAPERREES